MTKIIHHSRIKLVGPISQKKIKLNNAHLLECCGCENSLLIMDSDDERDELYKNGWGDPRPHGFTDQLLCPECDDNCSFKCEDSDPDHHCREYDLDVQYCDRCKFQHCVGCGCRFS